jgi:hypothetical protein
MEKKARFVNRNEGSGTRVLLEYLMREHNVLTPRKYSIDIQRVLPHIWSHSSLPVIFLHTTFQKQKRNGYSPVSLYSHITGCLSRKQQNKYEQYYYLLMNVR